MICCIMAASAAVGGGLCRLLQRGPPAAVREHPHQGLTVLGLHQLSQQGGVVLELLGHAGHFLVHVCLLIGEDSRTPSQYMMGNEKKCLHGGRHFPET